MTLENTRTVLVSDASSALKITFRFSIPHLVSLTMLSIRDTAGTARSLTMQYSLIPHSDRCLTSLNPVQHSMASRAIILIKIQLLLIQKNCRLASLTCR